jgi:hypothetical protein
MVSAGQTPSGDWWQDENGKWRRGRRPEPASVPPSQESEIATATAPPLPDAGDAVERQDPQGGWWQDERGNWRRGDRPGAPAADEETSQHQTAPDGTFSARGRNGQLTVTPTSIIISRKGIAGFLTQGHKGEKEIDLSQISAIQFKKSGALTAGYIQFSFVGGAETKGGIRDAVNDENSILFNDGQESAFRHARRLVDEYRSRLRRPPAAESAGLSVDDLERLAALRSSGVISDDEFEAAKRKILGL